MVASKFVNAKFKWRKWQMLYCCFVAILLAIFSGITTSLTVTTILDFARDEAYWVKRVVWQIAIVFPSALFTIFFFKRNFLQGALMGGITLMPLCLCMAFQTFIPETLFDLLGVPALPSFLVLVFIVVGITSIVIALIIFHFFLRKPYLSVVWLLVLVSSGAAFLVQDLNLSDRFLGAFASGCIARIGHRISVRALGEVEEYFWMKSTVIAISSLGRKSFRGCDLTDADFSGANLTNVDLTDATLLHTCWRDAVGLEYARLGNSYLGDPAIRQLVTSLQGKKKTFSALNLEGANLNNADLRNCQFVSTNLNFATLVNADLSGANLKQSQLDGTNLSGANLTGAYIEDWGITKDTKLSDIRCKYVFMHVPTENDPNPMRKPDNWRENFNENDFSDFIKPYFDTLDLYHSQDINPRAISLALKELSRNNPEASLEIVALEKRGSSFNLKLLVATHADKSDLNTEYFDSYNQLRSLPASTQLLLAEKDNRILSLENMIGTALNQPRWHVQGNLLLTEDKSITVHGDASNSAFISGDHNINNRQP